MRLIILLFCAAALCPLLLSAQLGTCVRGDCKNGVGRIVYNDGASYDGGFTAGRYTGLGMMTYPNGAVYAGSWHEGLQQGRGRFTEADGTEYKGWFSRGRRQGQGEITFPDGNRIKGNWRADQILGAGEFNFANGDYYRGQITDARLVGQGTMQYANGDEYIGGWQNSARHGFGRMRFENGTELQGQWVENKFITDWSTLGFRGDASRVAICDRGCPDGIRRINYADGRSYVGDVSAGVARGSGTITYPNGNIYYGGVANDVPDGLGLMVFADGIMHGGIWQGGRSYRRLYTGRRQLARAVAPTYDESTKVWAVVVGAARYSHMQTLRYTDDDAYHLYAFLKSVEGGALPDNQIKILVDDDATKQNIQDAIRQVYQQADENDMVLFYFSGHGVPGAFLPVDYDGVSNRFEHYELREALKSCRAKHKLVIADACHSGSLSGQPEPTLGLVAKNGGAGAALAAYYQGLADAKASTALFLSSRGEEISLEDGGLRSGVFSHYLIRGMKGEADQNADSLISIQELFGFVHREVRRYTGNVQTPTLTGVYDAGMPISVVRR